MSHKSLIVIPGFLTEPHTLARQDQSSAFNKLDPSAALDRRAWELAFQHLTHDDVEVLTFQWASQSAIELLWETLGPILKQARNLSLDFVKSQLMKSAGDIHDAWTQARTECDAQIQALHELIAERCNLGEVQVIGHSLGARLALKTMHEQAQQGHSLDYKLSAWAPAISLKDLDWERLSRQKYLPEIMYSQADLVLKLIYPLGQGARPSGHMLDIITLLASLMNSNPQKQALGLIGPPSVAASIKQRSIDLSAQNIRHLTYLPSAEYLFKSSQYLKEYLKTS